MLCFFEQFFAHFQWCNKAASKNSSGCRQTLQNKWAARHCTRSGSKKHKERKRSYLLSRTLTTKKISTIKPHTIKPGWFGAVVSLFFSFFHNDHNCNHKASQSQKCTDRVKGVEGEKNASKHYENNGGKICLMKLQAQRKEWDESGQHRQCSQVFWWCVFAVVVVMLFLAKHDQKHNCLLQFVVKRGCVVVEVVLSHPACLIHALQEMISSKDK